jgi:dynein heavy chain
LPQAKDESGKAILDFWKPSLGLLSDKDLIARLKSYDKDNIPPKCVGGVSACGGVHARAAWRV